MKRVEGIIRPERLGQVASTLESSGFSGFTMSDVRGHGQLSRMGEYRGNTYEMLVNHKLKKLIFFQANAEALALATLERTLQRNAGLE